jgi:hypothetical protein
MTKHLPSISHSDGTFYPVLSLFDSPHHTDDQTASLTVLYCAPHLHTADRCPSSRRSPASISKSGIVSHTDDRTSAAFQRDGVYIQYIVPSPSKRHNTDDQTAATITSEVEYNTYKLNDISTNK